MREALLKPAGGLALLVAAAGVALGGCRPNTEGGYAKVTHRPPPAPVAASHPAPPPPNPALMAAPAAKPVVLRSPPAGVTQAMVDEGQKNFTLCASCHGQGGTGTAAAPPLNDAQWLNITGEYNEIVALINSGVPVPKEYPGMMPPKGGGSFTDEQVRQIAAYVFALSHQGGQ